MPLEETVTEITASKTEDEIRAAMLADGYIEVDRDGHPISVLDNILRNEKARAILQDAVKKLKKIGCHRFKRNSVYTKSGTPPRIALGNAS